MIASLLYIIPALLGITFLIFIHELGHYFLARRVGITVEVFSIGFGKPIYQWEYRGVKWKICWIPFGGYVKMAGMEKKGILEPYQIPGGFFSKSPFHRIQVAAIGPLVNIAFAFIAFSLLWATGGRLKPFAEFSRYIGWVDRDSSLYATGVRGGDEIQTLNGRPFTGFHDFLYGAYLDKSLSIGGMKLDYFGNDSPHPFVYTFPSQKGLTEEARAAIPYATLGPATYLMYYPTLLKGGTASIPPAAPIQQSGLVYGDQIVWIDGVPVFSLPQLIAVVNSPRVLLTVERDGHLFLTRVPRLKIADLRLTTTEKGELDDWRHAAGLVNRKVDTLDFIPYNLDSEGVVEGPLGYIDERSRAQLVYEEPERSPFSTPLKRGDRIVAVQGSRIDSAYALLKQIQERRTLVIVRRDKEEAPLSWNEANERFPNSFQRDHILQIAQAVGTEAPISHSGDFHLLRPITPVHRKAFPLTPHQSKLEMDKLDARKKEIEEIQESTKKEMALKEMEREQNRLILGIQIQDRQVAYNPTPFALFSEVVESTYRTLLALFSGHLSPKHMAGPVAIVQVIQTSWSVGFKEGLFWLGMISLNLGLLNLLPVPVLDGGHIVLALVEQITKKPLKAKTLERLTLPFVLLLVALFIYLTYHDIARIFVQLFK